MKVALLTTDNREQLSLYDKEVPFFGPAPEALVEGFRQLGPEIELHIVSCTKQVMAAPEKLADNIWFHQPHVPHLGWGRSFFAGCVLAVRKKLREINPEIVHGQGTERDCAVAAVHSGFPNVLTIHGNMAEIQRLGMHGNNVYGWMASHLENHALKRTAGVFCNSLYTRDLVAPRTRKTWLVSNAIRPPFLEQPRAIHPPNPKPVLINVGLVCPRKRQLELLRAVKELSAEGHELKIIFVGPLSGQGAYSGQFTAEMKEAEASGHAEYRGYLDVEPLIDLMDMADGFVHFPLEEAFGLVVAESMIRHLKFFGADLGGVKDIATGVPGAELHGTVEELKQGIVRWLEAGAPRSPEAAPIMESLYSPKAIAKRHLEIYREVLHRPTP